jgi:hypothetical protein
MSQDNGSATAMTAASNGRPIKFTPERFEQIKTLVERGMLREHIAETIGVTLGSLQVTCSRGHQSAPTAAARPSAIEEIVNHLNGRVPLVPNVIDGDLGLVPLV